MNILLYMKWIFLRKLQKKASKQCELREYTIKAKKEYRHHGCCSFSLKSPISFCEHNKHYVALLMMGTVTKCKDS
eukprot:UN04289